MHSISSSSTVIHVPDVSYFFSSQSKRHIRDICVTVDGEEIESVDSEIIRIRSR